MLSNLPPGVTDQMIDDHFGGGSCEPCLDGEHADCEGDCACERCEEDAAWNAAETRWEQRMEK